MVEQTGQGGIIIVLVIVQKPGQPHNLLGQTITVSQDIKDQVFLHRVYSTLVIHYGMVLIVVVVKLLVVSVLLFLGFINPLLILLLIILR